MQGGKSRGSVRKSLRLAKLRNMETPEPISRNRAADIGGGRSGVYANIFPAPTENRAPPPFPASSFARLPPARIAVPCLFLLVAFLLSIARFSRHLFLLLSLFLSLSFAVHKKMKARVDNRHALFISDLALFPRPSSFSPLCRVAFPSSYSRKRPGGFHRGRYTLCIVYLECWVNVSSHAEISKPSICCIRDIESIINFTNTFIMLGV